MRSKSQNYAIPLLILLVSICIIFELCCVLRVEKNARIYIQHGGPEISSSSTNPSSSEAQLEIIPINPDSTIASDIVKIVHDPVQALIVIHFKDDARCPNPELRARLSGPSLGIINWLDETPPNTKHTTIQKGSYHVPVSGHYFIEIIVLLCSKLEFETNFESVCLEDPMNHRITHDSSSIHVSVSNRNSNNALGNWMRKKPKQSPRVDDSNESLVPLYTRFQPQGCRHNEGDKRCIGNTDLRRFLPYGFVWEEEAPQLALTKREDLGNITICLIGASHTRVIVEHWGNRWLDIKREWVELKFPRDLSPQIVDDMMSSNHCSKVIVGLGQWSAAGFPKGVSLFPQYEQEMKQAIEVLQKGYEMEIFVRSVHYNPIGDFIGKCEPWDWRSPPVIDGYNAILRRLCADANITFIDTDFIIGPVWDSAEDWCHFENEAGEMDASYILGKAIGVV